MVWYAPWSTKIFEYPTYVQTAVWTASKDEGSEKNEEMTFNSREGMTITGDISLSYSLNPKKVPSFYNTFRNDDLSLFTHGYMRNVARDAFNEIGATYSVDSIYGVKKEEFLNRVRDRINNKLDTVGVELSQLGFVGAIRLPQNVVQAINAKIQATQQAIQVENELRTATAEASKQVATATGDANSRIARAKGEAEANRLMMASITPQLIEWKKLELQRAQIDKWNGTYPQVFAGQNFPMLMNLGQVTGNK
jgi:regulator of protease activity HflC (stomatin/prohibitin superfamily)